MPGSNRYVDDAFWRDWVFWVGFAVATTNATAAAVLRDGSWWSVALAWFLALGATIAVFGFIRIVVRTYRQP